MGVVSRPMAPPEKNANPNPADDGQEDEPRRKRLVSPEKEPDPLPLPAKLEEENAPEPHPQRRSRGIVDQEAPPAHPRDARHYSVELSKDLENRAAMTTSAPRVWKNRSARSNRAGVTRTYRP